MAGLVIIFCISSFLKLVAKFGSFVFESSKFALFNKICSGSFVKIQGLLEQTVLFLFDEVYMSYVHILFGFHPFFIVDLNFIGSGKNS